MAFSIVYGGKHGQEQQWLVIDPPLQSAIRNGADAQQRKRIAALIKEALRQLSPKLTGRLSLRWNVAVLATGQIRLRNRQPYAQYQNTRTRNKGYIRRAIARVMPFIGPVLSGTSRTTPANLGRGPRGLGRGLPGAIARPPATADRRVRSRRG